jgi:hypothetical protein
MMVCGDVNIVCAHAAVMFDMHTIAPPEVTSKETAPIIKHTIESIVRDLAFFSFLTGSVNALTARREAMTPRALIVVPTLVVEGSRIGACRVVEPRCSAYVFVVFTAVSGTAVTLA